VLERLRCSSLSRISEVERCSSDRVLGILGTISTRTGSQCVMVLVMLKYSLPTVSKCLRAIEFRLQVLSNSLNDWHFVRGLDFSVENLATGSGGLTRPVTLVEEFIF